MGKFRTELENGLREEVDKLKALHTEENKVLEERLIALESNSTGLTEAQVLDLIEAHTPRRTLLWENPNPDASIGQLDIENVDLTGYDTIVIYASQFANTTPKSGPVFEFCFNPDEGCYATLTTNSDWTEDSDGGYIYQREVQLYKNSIEMKECYRLTLGEWGSKEQYDSGLVPYRIYGVKYPEEAQR